MSFKPRTTGDRRWRFVGKRFWHLLKLPQHVVDIPAFRLVNNHIVCGEFDATDWLRNNVTGYCVAQEVPGWRMLEMQGDDSLNGLITHIMNVTNGHTSQNAIRVQFTHKHDAILFKMSLP